MLRIWLLTLLMVVALVWQASSGMAAVVLCSSGCTGDACKGNVTENDPPVDDGEPGDAPEIADLHLEIYSTAIMTTENCDTLTPDDVASECQWIKALNAFAPPPKNTTTCDSFSKDPLKDLLVFDECTYFTTEFSPPPPAIAKTCDNASTLKSTEERDFCHEIVNGGGTLSGLNDEMVSAIAFVRGYRNGYAQCANYVKSFETGLGHPLGTIRWSLESYNTLWGCKIMFGTSGTAATRLASIEQDLKYLSDKPSDTLPKDVDILALYNGPDSVSPFVQCSDLVCCEPPWMAMFCDAGKDINGASCGKYDTCSGYTP